LQDIGGVKFLKGVEYKDFRGTYMGLAPASAPEDSPPFPLDEEQVKTKVFFFARVFDGGNMDLDVSDADAEKEELDEDENQLDYTNGCENCFSLL
jgi:hypothetical protein